MSKNLPDLIKELRAMTLAPMMDCKKALEENGLDVEKATAWLREKGLAKAIKKMGGVASDGQVAVVADEDTAIVYEVNCQTDFTALNDNFLALVQAIGKVLLAHKPKTVEAANELKLGSGDTVQEACFGLTAKIGEKIFLRRFQAVKRPSDGALAFYVHTGGRIAALAALSGAKNANVARDVAMHVSAMNPKFLDRDSYDPKWLEEERAVLLAQTVAEGKPKDHAQKIVEGRLAKLLSETALVEQPFVKDPALKVGKFVENAGGKVKEFVRYELGEGVEKKESNFAEEVAAQVRDAKNKK